MSGLIIVKEVTTLHDLGFPWPKVAVAPMIEEILGITGWNPSICKSNRLHVHILRFSFIKSGYII